MGAPIEHPDDVARAFDNPAGTNGLAFVEFSSRDTALFTDLFSRLGFNEEARHPTKHASLWKQAGITFLLNGEPDTHGGRFSALHGPCISRIAFRVADAQRAGRRALELGGAAYQNSEGLPVVTAGVVLAGIGGSLLELLDPSAEAALLAQFEPVRAVRAEKTGDAGFLEIDHLTHNVHPGHLEQWADFYRRVFNFREVFYMDARGSRTGMRTRAMKSPCNKICIPVNEPTEPQSQIQEFIDQYHGEGVQHIALRSGDLNRSMQILKPRPLPTHVVPEAYYAAIDKRLPGHGQNVEELRRNGILLDGNRDPSTGTWELLLQVFSRNLFGPIFFEFIERRGNEGFGEGNAQALFEALERDQMERGVVAGP